MDKNQLYLKYLTKDSDYYEKLADRKNSVPYIVNDVPDHCFIRTEENSPWKFYNFKNKRIKDQGWKIHVSATIDNSQAILEAVSRILIEREIAFKHIMNETLLHSINSKNGNRVSSGKFITIYPSTDEQFLELLHLLYEKIQDHENGPYILSDKCWKNSNLYYRYGGFRNIHNENGELCIKDPSGNLIPDNRTPYYQVPEFVKDFDEFLDANNDSPEESEDTFKLKEYEFQSSLRFTNGGGIYLAERKKDKKKVVIKEARPKVGLDGQNKDAIDRLNKEYEALSKLVDVKGVVQVLDYFKSWKHLFLVEEYVEGVDLKTWIASKYPFHRNKDKETYMTDVKKIILSLLDIVTDMHRQDIGMGDLQPSNIMITKDVNVILIDFESANHKDHEEKAAIHTIGFSDQDNKNHKERDWYAVKKTLRYCVLPIGPISGIEGNISSYQNQWIEEEFGKDFYSFVRYIEDRCDEHLSSTKEEKYNTINQPYRSYENLSEELNTVIEDLRKGIMANVVPEKLIHGDIRQYENSGGKINVLTGGTGAALALHRTGIVDEQVIHWIENDLINHIDSVEPHGLFTGKAGIATTLYELGYKEESVTLFSELTRDCNDISLRSGLAGTGLALISLYLEENNDLYLKKAEKIASHMKDFVSNDKSLSVQDWAAVPVGLIDGWSGASLFFAAMYSVTKDQSFYLMAKDLIELELKNTQIDQELNVLQTVDDRKRLLAYLSGGSIGIGIAIWYLNHVSGDNLYQEELASIVHLNHIRCTFSGGLFDGAGGFLLIPPIVENTNRIKEEHIKLSMERLNLFFIRRENQLLFPGNFCYRLSHDLYSGSSGIMLGLKGVLESNPLYWLPIIHVNRFITKTDYRNKTIATL
ncbi:class III lanthionine synthetase LanKC [Paenibacillus faecalis]|uniref:class III lanthionine synthetase LanKC n=1 Tax=Paenibacillus faecalis TaxID=2079532 RepID=UPI000D0FE6A3|nr:class III lanthionine synthetase LanKC [Paenibacillus faecalis]